jgi:hypothetical protein
MTNNVSTTIHSKACEVGSCRNLEAARAMISVVHADEGNRTHDCSSIDFIADQSMAEEHWTGDGIFTIDTLLLPCWRPANDVLHLQLRTRQAKDSLNYSSTAVNTVFNTYELLEAILKDVSMLDLLLHCQRVSQMWRAVINDSHGLQQKLFMAAAPEPLEQNEKYKSYNPLLLSHCLVSKLDRRAGQHSPQDLLAPAPLDQFAFRIPSSSEPLASWRKMFIKQPPIAAVRLEVSVYGEFLRAGEFDSTKAFRMGDIMENPGYEMCGHVTGNGQECRHGILRVIELPSSC